MSKSFSTRGFCHFLATSRIGYTHKNIGLLSRQMGAPERMPGLDLLAPQAGRIWEPSWFVGTL